MLGPNKVIFQSWWVKKWDTQIEDVKILFHSVLYSPTLERTCQMPLYTSVSVVWWTRTCVAGAVGRSNCFLPIAVIGNGNRQRTASVKPHHSFDYFIFPLCCPLLWTCWHLRFHSAQYQKYNYQKYNNQCLQNFSRWGWQPQGSFPTVWKVDINSNNTTTGVELRFVLRIWLDESLQERILTYVRKGSPLKLSPGLFGYCPNSNCPFELL